MGTAKLYYLTNRRHEGDDRWHPTGYGIEPSKDGTENLRFGRVTLTYDKTTVSNYLGKGCGFGNGDGEELAAYLCGQSGSAVIEAFEEKLDKGKSDIRQAKKRFGSRRTLGDLRRQMENGSDVLIFIHGFNVSWWEAVASALSLEFMLNHMRGASDEKKPVRVVLFTWPSDGKAIPLYSYFSDRSDAESSGGPVGRGFLKLRDYLIEARLDSRSRGAALCRQAIHLLCHSMGNYVLQNALHRTQEFSTAGKPPRIFDQMFLCAPDVADDVFEPGKPMRQLPEMAQNVTIYHNKGDLAMPVSDYTKGNTDRLGWGGASRPTDLDARVHQVDCSPIVTGLIEHSYYLCGYVNDDIRQSIDGLSPDSTVRRREPVVHGWPNVWRIPSSEEESR